MFDVCVDEFFQFGVVAVHAIPEDSSSCHEKAIRYRVNITLRRSFTDS